MNLFNIENAFKLKKERGWDWIYVSIDLHGTLIKPYHHCIEFYPHAIEVMRWFNSRDEFKTILWTSSYATEIESIEKALELKGARFDYVNENPIQPSSDRADFSKKFYFTILLDDKAGFEGAEDWGNIKDELIRIGEWDKCIAGGEHNWGISRGINGQHSTVYCKKCFNVAP